VNWGGKGLGLRKMQLTRKTPKSVVKSGGIYIRGGGRGGGRQNKGVYLLEPSGAGDLDRLGSREAR